MCSRTYKTDVGGRQIAQDARDQAEARNAVAVWLDDDLNVDVVSVSVNRGDVAVVLAGPGEPPPADELLRGPEISLGGEITLDLQWIPRRRLVVSSVDG